jgi:superfamily II DNA or RNA helicase
MEFELHDWQDEALDAWIEKDQKGIVEAVTGSGKTYLALAAIHRVNSTQVPQCFLTIGFSVFT